MTSEQITRIQTKIIKLRKILAAERARFGGYDDSAGRRYAILNLYVSIGDYKGAAVYLRWFFKNFPDDSGSPFFWVEACLTYFYNNKLEQARSMAFKAFVANPYTWEVFFTGIATEVEGIKPRSNWESLELALQLPYRADQEVYSAFTSWLQDCLVVPKMQELIQTYFDLKLKLSTTPIGPKRTSLVEQLYGLKI
jgi:tetratricopeptide (TPR) repeat protein